MTTFANIIVGAVVLASVYALVGSGFVVLYRSTGVLNFAQGAFMAIGALLFATMSSTTTSGWSRAC
jgi:branched-chain amino acid transport system permease protein